MTEETKRRGRGVGKKPAMVYVSLRVDREVAEFFNQFPSKSKVIREALQQYINNEEKEKQNEEQ